jgi:hypothetical protein
MESKAVAVKAVQAVTGGSNSTVDAVGVGAAAVAAAIAPAASGRRCTAEQLSLIIERKRAKHAKLKEDIKRMTELLNKPTRTKEEILEMRMAAAKNKQNKQNNH